ncbi:MAG: flagellar biosynthesis protein FlhA [Gammaproteobacteria bacterium HGW-Gammaproteobacteria-1]|jgi:flagellar biosynthesis protein FlhA|nr:MAG: flagellar biosynthesis protein FlhA [Gammaproteobacteria bacterium HGW-Gammaproteobacteria-1]
MAQFGGVLHTTRMVLASGLGAPIIVLILLSMVVLPLPPFLLDIFFTFNIALSLIILLVTVYALRPLDFAVFPTVLLIATLLRLALNVASTRVVLLEGHTGTGAAGQVIESFGEFVVGGNYAVGLVVFIILVIINFAVVTKGAGRISEVSARFTLDAMPGKQMAIDADLNAGLIDADTARTRRDEIAREADFYGSMDGASKFVRGDAVAGILITIINIIGGLTVGVAQHDMPFGDAAQVYTLLTIGDGLVAQIPSLVLSTAAGIIITRVSASRDMGEMVIAQVFSNPRVLTVTAGVLLLLGLIPGMPNLPFLLLAAALGGGAWWLFRKQKAEAAARAAPPPVAPAAAEPSTELKELTWDDVPLVDPVGLEVGYRLIPLVDKAQGGQLMARIKGVRKKLSQELGFLVPAVHIRDNLDLSPTAYRVTLLGVTVGEAEIFPDREMAINPGQVYGQLSGIKTTDPAFGLEAVWVEPGRREEAQGLGYTVVDPNTVVATHLSQLLQSHAHELLGHEEVQHLLSQLAKAAPKLVEDLVPKLLPTSVVVKVLQNLLAEGIPIRDMRSIAETLAEHAPRTQDAGILTSAIRVALGRMIVQKINGLANELPVITLAPELEQILLKSIRASEEGGAGIEPGLAERIHRGLAQSSQKQEMAGQPAVLLVSAPLRELLARFVRHTIPGMHVLAYNEVPDSKQLRIVATVGNQAG